MPDAARRAGPLAFGLAPAWTPSRGRARLVVLIHAADLVPNVVAKAEPKASRPRTGLPSEVLESSG